MARQKTKKYTPRRRKSSYRKRAVFAYPFIIFTLLCAGVYLVGSTLKASGDNIFVTAEVHGPAVTNPAVIKNPKNGQHFKSIPISVSGTCPVNAAYVEIFRNNLLSGTAICDNNLEFELSIDLFPGQNNLVAHPFNVTDDAGPVSPTVTVYYDAPQPTAVSNNTGGQPSPVAPLSLTTTFIYKGYYVGQQVKWPLRLSGGTAPYGVSVDWGDGNSDVISRPTAGDFNISHTYTTPGSVKSSYAIKIKAGDAAGQKAYLQFFVIVNVKKDMAPAGGIFNKPPPSFSDRYHWLFVAWPAYVLVVLMAASYILGEREELLLLRRNGFLRRR